MEVQNAPKGAHRYKVRGNHFLVFSSNQKNGDKGSNTGKTTFSFLIFIVLHFNINKYQITIAVKVVPTINGKNFHSTSTVSTLSIKFLQLLPS